MKKFMIVLLAGAMAGSLLTGCAKAGTASGAGTAAPPVTGEAGAQLYDGEPPGSGAAAKTRFGLEPLEERQTISIGFFSGSAHSIPFYIAEQEGFFDELNIDVEYQSFINGPAMMEANASWDIADVGDQAF